MLSQSSINLLEVLGEGEGKERKVGNGKKWFCHPYTIIIGG